MGMPARRAKVANADGCNVENGDSEHPNSERQRRLLAAEACINGDHVRMLEDGDGKRGRWRLDIGSIQRRP